MPVAGRAIRTIVVAVVGVIAIASAVVLVERTQQTPFHGDESGWISSAIYYTNLLRELDFAREKWDCIARCGVWGDLNPHVGKWLIGLAYLRCAREEECAFDGYYKWTLPFQENVRLGNVPPRELLTRGRLSAAIAGVLCVLAVFLIGLNLGSLRLSIGLAAAALLLGNEVFLHLATRAMPDAHYNLFLLGVCASCLLILKTRRRNGLLILSVLAGLLTALAGSVKASGVMLGGALFVTVVGYILVVQRSRRSEAAAAVVAFAASCLVVIYALNPTFWPEIKTEADETVQVSGSARLLNFPRLFLRWNRFVHSQEAAGIGEWTGNRVLDINRSAFLRYTRSAREDGGGAHVGLIVDGLFLVGLGICVRRVLTSFRASRLDASFIPLSWFLINYVFLLAFTRLNWDRYYLPVIISILLMASIALGEFIGRCRSALSIVVSRMT